MNVAVAASIVLHHFALWAGYAEQARQGEKYVVAPRPTGHAKRHIPMTAEERAAARTAAAEPADSAADAATAAQLQQLLE